MPLGLLEHKQRRVALEPFSEGGCSLRSRRSLILSLRVRVRRAGAEECQRALTQRQTLWGGGAPERGHGASLERLAQLGDALGGVGAAAATVKAAELVSAKLPREGGVSMGADTKANARGGGALQLLRSASP